MLVSPCGAKLSLPQAGLTTPPMRERYTPFSHMNSERIHAIKSGAIIVNTSPMELFDLDALEARLKKGDITFIFDHSDEMTKEDLQRFSKYDNCIIYPPIGYISREASIAKQEIFVSNVENFIGGNPTNSVVSAAKTG